MSYLDKPSGSLLQRLVVARHDLEQAAFYVDHLLKKEWHSETFQKRRWQTYMQQTAFCTALMVAYCRPYTQSHGWPKFPKELSPYSEQEWRLHKKLLSLRNEVYAHSDIGKRKVRNLSLFGKPLSVIQHEKMVVSKQELELLQGMLKSTQQAISRRCTELAAKLSNAA